MSQQGVAQPGPFSPFIEKAGLFLKANSSMVGPSEGVEIRFPDRRNEHEVELRHRVRQSRAATSRVIRPLDYVAGYCIGLDMTARGQEDRSYRKSIDSYSVLGPWLVTADEIPDPDNVPLRIFVNGEKKQESNTNMLIFDCKKLIEWGSTFYTWYPGRRAVHRHAGRRQPGEAGRHHARGDRSDRRDVDRGARASAIGLIRPAFHPVVPAKANPYSRSRDERRTGSAAHLNPHQPGDCFAPAIMSASLVILIGRLFTAIPSGASASLTALAIAAGAPR